MAKEILLSIKEACALWEVSKPTIAGWVKIGFPKAGRGKYPLFAGQKWYLQNLADNSSLQEERRKKLQVERSIKELELAQKRAELISNQDHKDQLLELVQITRAGFLALPRRLPGELEGLIPRDMEPIIKREVHEVLTRLSQMADDGEKRRSSPPPPPPSLQ